MQSVHAPLQVPKVCNPTRILIKVIQKFQSHLMYLKLKFPTSILIEILEEFHKNSVVI